MTDVAAPFLPFARPSITDRERAAVLEVLDSGWLTTGSQDQGLRGGVRRARRRPPRDRPQLGHRRAPPGARRVRRGRGRRGDRPDVDVRRQRRGRRLPARQGRAGRRRARDPQRHHRGHPRRRDAADEGRRSRSTSPGARWRSRSSSASSTRGASRSSRTAPTRSRAGSAVRAAPMAGTVGPRRRLLVLRDEDHHARARAACSSPTTTPSPTRVRLMSLHGISRDAWKRYTAGGSWYYEIEDAGYKYNMTDIAAALGLVQLDRAEELLEARLALVERYRRAFAASGVGRPARAADRRRRRVARLAPVHRAAPARPAADRPGRGHGRPGSRRHRRERPLHPAPHAPVPPAHGRLDRGARSRWPRPSTSA